MKLRNLINKVTRTVRSKAFVAAAVVTAVAGLGFGAVQAEFYPDRQPFDYNVPCNPNDANIYDRCGSLTGPVFNSFVNTPSYGDERAFVDARRSDQTASGSYKNVLDSVNEGSQEVVIRAYVHNNANQSLNESGKGIAKGTTVRFDLPEAEGNVLRARGYIDANNAALVEDTVDFRGTTDFRVEYIPGSAIMYNNGPFKSGVKLADTIVTGGAPIGYDKLNGDLPGCFDYEAVVQIRVKIIPVVNEDADLEFDKLVRMKGTKEWKEVVAAKPGDKVEWLLDGRVSGEGEMDGIVVRDVAAPNTSLVPGSVTFINSQETTTWADGPLFDGGYELRDTYSNGGGFYVLFESTVSGDFEGCEARVRNQAFIRSNQHPNEIKDTADVIITKENCEEVEEPVVVCESLTAPRYNLAPGEKTTFTVKATAKNTTITGYAFAVNDEVVQMNESNTYEFTAGEEGVYYIAAAVLYEDDGVVTGINCVKTVDVEKEISPKYRCDLLEVNAKEIKAGQTVSVKVRVTAKDGAEFKYATIAFGDEASNQDRYVTDKINDGIVKASHTYDEEGEYTISATINFDVNGEEKVVTSEKCVAELTVSETPKTPETPEELPNTGAGTTIGMLVAVAAIGAYAHRALTLKRQ